MAVICWDGNEASFSCGADFEDGSSGRYSAMEIGKYIILAIFSDREQKGKIISFLKKWRQLDEDDWEGITPAKITGAGYCTELMAIQKETGIVFLYKDGFFYKLSAKKYAIGEGAKYAMGAMYAGATSVDAVRAVDFFYSVEKESIITVSKSKMYKMLRDKKAKKKN